jgi:ribosomal protein S18 acetylase RimI-like enzyme
MEVPLHDLVLNEARAYEFFAGGKVTDHSFAVSLVCDQLQDSRFNRAYVLESGQLTAESLHQLTRDFVSVSLPFRMDVFLPVSGEIEQFLERLMFTVTENFASEMVLTKSATSLETNPAVRIRCVKQDDIDTFSTVLMKAYEMPPAVVPVVLPILHQTISRALEHEGVTLYLGYCDSRPVGVLYLFSHQGVGGLYNLGVLPESRKEGVARTLMLRAIEDSRAYGNSTLCLQTRAESFEERFYTQLGFKVVARRNRAVQAPV